MLILALQMSHLQKKKAFPSVSAQFSWAHLLQKLHCIQSSSKNSSHSVSLGLFTFESTWALDFSRLLLALWLLVFCDLFVKFLPRVSFLFLCWSALLIFVSLFSYNLILKGLEVRISHPSLRRFLIVNLRSVSWGIGEILFKSACNERFS
jgi:hypothetical protein